MSIEEYFNSEMYRAKDELSSIITEDTIDWVRFDSVLSSLPNINAIYDKDTILSELYHECPDGTVLVEITKRFLAQGYDVNENEGLNGSQCLHNLSWATFDKYILDAAKLLLEAGARTDIPLDADSDNSEGKGVKASISWRLGGDWVEGDYTIANIFEAYWEIIEAFEAGKDYHLICGFEDCIGETLNRVDFIPAANNSAVRKSNQVSFFDGQLVLWFGSKPLVISKYIDFVVNPIAVEHNKDSLICVDTSFETLLHARLNQFVFIDQCIAQLIFDNGQSLLLSSTDYRDEDHRQGIFEIRTIPTDVDILKKQISRLALMPGKLYSDTCRHYDEASVALICDEEAFLLHEYPEGYSDSHEIRIVECSKQLISSFKRSVALPELIPDEAFPRNGKLAAIRMRSGTRYLYLFVKDSRALQLKLDEKRFTSYEEVSYWRDGEKIEFWVDSPVAYIE